MIRFSFRRVRFPGAAMGATSLASGALVVLRARTCAPRGRETKSANSSRFFADPIGVPCRRRRRSVHASRFRSVPRRTLRAVGLSKSGVLCCSLSTTRRWYAVSRFCDAAAERWQVEAELLQLAQPVRSLDANHLAQLRDHPHEVARHHACPSHHVPCADGHALESRAQDVVRLQEFVERSWRSATGCC